MMVIFIGSGPGLASGKLVQLHDGVDFNGLIKNFTIFRAGAGLGPSP